LKAVLEACAVPSGRQTERGPGLCEDEVYDLLEAEGIAAPARSVVSSPDEVDGALLARLPGRGVVVKARSPEVPHKSDVGGLEFCAPSVEAVQAAVRRVLGATRRACPSAEIRGALLVEKVEHRRDFGREILAGFRHDPAFGPVVLLGLGGLDTEYMLAALAPERGRAVWAAEGLDAEGDVLPRLRRLVVADAFAGLLRGSRGAGEPLERLAGLVLALARLARRHAAFGRTAGVALAELEVNPFVLAEDGRLIALDGLARRRAPRELAPPRPLGRLSRLYSPHSVAVIGASASASNPGRVILRNLVQGGGFEPGRLLAVHPSASLIEGCPTYASLAEAPWPVDLAVVAVPAGSAVEPLLNDLVEHRRARAVVLVPGGLAETESGRPLEERLRALFERSHRDADGGVLLNGGNCLGLVSEPGRLNTFFIPSYKLPRHEAPARQVALLSQSGAYLVTQLSRLDGVVRPRYAVSFGNQVDLTLADHLEHLAGDPAVETFTVYLEGFRPGDGRRFLEVARRLRREGRTVLLYKAGRTAEGAAAAASHTAAVVGDHEVCRELARGAGVVDCLTLNMFEDALLAFSLLSGRRAPGGRVAVLTNAGFECAAAADRLYGLRLASLSPDTTARLRALLPRGLVEVRNPVDATPATTTADYVACAEALLADPEVEALVVAGVPATPALDTLDRGPGHEEDVHGPGSLASRLVALFRRTDKPLVCSMDGGALYEPSVQWLRTAGLPCYHKVDRATRALALFLGTWP
jgi:acyl-CoA synthetase (NDP forming)